MTRRKVLLGSGHRGQLLPPGYQQVEYLQSQGSQWIDTGLFLSSDASVEIKSYTDNARVTSGLSFSVFGAFTTRNSGINRFALYGSGKQIYEYIGSYSQHGHTAGDAGNVLIAGFNAVFFNKIGVLVNGNRISTVTGDPETFTTTATALIFAINSQTLGPQIGGNSKIARVDVNDTWSRSFIACYRKSDSKPGMYEIVTNTFFTNQGADDFLVGPDVI